MIDVGFVVFPGVTMLDVSGPAEVFCGASGQYRVTYVSAAGGAVATSAGMAIADTVPAAGVEALDTLIVPGSEGLSTAPIDRALLGMVGRLATGARRVASVCTGAFILAELGLLDGRRATTHWRQAGELARRYPAVEVAPDTIHVRDGRFFSSAGITAGIDLALALVEDDLGSGAAREVARELVVFLQRPGGQSQFATAVAGQDSRHELLAPVIRQVRDDPAGHTVSSMAAAAALSPRHLHRLFVAELGATPARWLEGVRLDRACRLILDGRSVTRAAELSGFGSDESLRRAFGRQLGTTPSEYRARFATTRSG